MTAETQRRALDAMYAEMPSLDCQGKCAEACGPIAMTRVEWERITERGEVAPIGPDLTCPLLAGERCTVYDVRPMICRLWGMVESMPCLWGCKPSRMLTDVEGRGFLERAGALGA